MKETESSSAASLTDLLRAAAVKARPLRSCYVNPNDPGTYRSNHINPSVAVRFLSVDSLLIICSNVDDVAGYDDCLSRIFLILPVISF